MASIFSSISVGPAVEVVSRARAAAPRWELGLRYAAAYASTLLAIGAAQAKIGAAFAVGLALVTLLGLPLSLSLRRAHHRWEHHRLSRPLFSLLVVLLSGAISLLLMRGKMQLGGAGWDTLSFFAPNRYMELMISVTLIIAACRCLFILTDRDALACLVPSFSVLLLLIVLHRETSVIFYFVAWAVVTAVLLALDHRAESREGLNGCVPAITPRQAVALPARSLGGVICFSLLCAMGLSYGLASRSTDTRAPGESWIYDFISRIGFLVPDLPDLPGGGGLERRIDFLSGPALPSRRVLWQVQATAENGRRSLQPAYWRAFTLARYDGLSWSQAVEAEMPSRELQPHNVTPREPPTGRRSGRRRSSSRMTSSFFLRPDMVVGGKVLRAPMLEEPGDYRFEAAPRRASHEPLRAPFGPSGVRVVQLVRSRTVNTGYLPALPAALTLTLRNTYPATVQARDDGSLDTKVLQGGQTAQVISTVPPLDEYGASRYSTTWTVPPQRRGERPNAAAHLSARERRLYLSLPRQLPRRVRALAAGVLRRAARNESDYRRAGRLALFVQNRASYTLRPPQMPVGRDATDFFLFDSRRGYCTYFAGALTVLCRAAGIPARVVSGFANPEWDNEAGGENSGIIREANGHAWTEVWVDGWGWAMLDATSSDDRGDNAPGLWTELADIIGAQATTFWRWLRPHAPLLGWLALPLLMLAGAMGVACAGNRWKNAPLLRRLGWWGQAPPAADDDGQVRRQVRAAYGRVARQMTRRFRERAPGETAAEWLQSAEAALTLQDPQPLRGLTELYTRACYSRRPLDPSETEAALRALSQLSWKRRPKPAGARQPLGRAPSAQRGSAQRGSAQHDGGAPEHRS